MKDVLAIAVSALTLLTLSLGLYLAVLRFGLKRESATFLEMSLDASCIPGGTAMVLVTISVRLVNKGDTRIDARRRGAGGRTFLYDDLWDRVEHAGTLKVRPVAVRDEPWVFDWYALPSADAMIERCTIDDKPHQVRPRKGDLEQVNYLGEYQDSAVNYRDVDFWLEPKESYEFSVPVWLPPGTYAAKAFFLGRRDQPGEEEFWSSTRLFAVRPLPEVNRDARRLPGGNPD